MESAPERADAPESAVHPRRAPPSDIPAWKLAGLGALDIGPGHARQSLQIAPWMRDAEGRLAPGLLAVIADSVLGFSIMFDQPPERGMATTHLHLELPRPMPREIARLQAEAERRVVDGRFGVGDASIKDGSGMLLAKATIGALMLDAPTRHDRSAASTRAAHTTHATPGAHEAVVKRSPILSEFGGRILEADAQSVRLLLSADRRCANRSGGVHGGFGALMGERALALALELALRGQRCMRPVELRAAFLRPVVADGAYVESRARVMHLGRRLAAARGELCDHDGRPAVLVDATYLADPMP